MDEVRVKHLEMVQAVINRLAGNSFTLKGWSITLVSALLALSAKELNWYYAVIALVTAMSFWGLDAYYLRQERLFRALYEAIRDPGAGPVIPSFSMNTAPIQDRVVCWFQVFWSKTLFSLHGSIVVVIVAVIIYGVRH